METAKSTVNTVVQVATKAIWGEQNATSHNETEGKEPVSGLQGAGTATEPFDQGNKEPAATTTTASTSDATPSPAIANMTEKSPIPSKTDSAAIVGESNSTPTSKPSDSDVSPSDATKPPSATLSSSVAPSDALQGADKPLATPESSVLPASSATTTAITPAPAAIGQEPKGTGEQHVTTSGVAAAGGNFDAAKPGAGKEANRLMEAKEHTAAPAETVGAVDKKVAAPAAGEEKEKVSKMAKLKEKLHIGSSHKSK